MTDPQALRAAAERLAEFVKYRPHTEISDDLRLILSRLDILEAENARLREADAWRPIESAPRDGTAILLWFDFSAANSRTQIGRWRKGLWEFKNHCSWGSGVKGAASFWRPLPSPPVQP